MIKILLILSFLANLYGGSFEKAENYYSQGDNRKAKRYYKRACREGIKEGCIKYDELTGNSSIKANSISRVLIGNSNEIVWSENSVINESKYLKSLQEYVKIEFPEKWENTQGVKTPITFSHYSSYKMRYSDVSSYCYNLVYQGYDNWRPENAHSSSNTGLASCTRHSFNIKYTGTKYIGIDFYDFLNDKKKFSIFVNYIISNKYNLVKDKFEKASAFQKRVDYVNENIDTISANAINIAFPTVYGNPKIESVDYDAEREIFYGLLTSSNGNYKKKIAINMPPSIARNFYDNVSYTEPKIFFNFIDNKLILNSIVVPYEGTEYLAMLRDKDYKSNKINIALKNQAIKYSEASNIKKIGRNDISKLLKKSKAKQESNKKWLFIVGIENYEFTNSVKYSSQSAKDFKAVMKKRLGIPEKNVRTLINREATSAKINYKLKDMLRRVKKGDTVYFYYSGHGIPVPSKNNAPYLLAQDMNPAYIDDDRFKLQNIYKALSNSKATKVVTFIDSCFSGGTDNQQLIKGVAAARLKPKSVTFDKKKMIVISAGSGTQYSNKYEAKNSRLFTYYIMRGLINNNTNMQRLYDYVKSNVQDKSYEMGASYEQVPVYSGNIGLEL